MKKGLLTALCIMCFIILASPGYTQEINYQQAIEMVKSLPCKNGGNVDSCLAQKSRLQAVLTDVPWAAFPLEKGYEIERVIWFEGLKSPTRYKWHVNKQGQIFWRNEHAMGIEGR